jgi:hypothetical protein
MCGLRNDSHLTCEGLDCEILINAVNLRPALWEQGDKNYQNRDRKLKMWEEMAAECKCSQLCSARLGLQCVWALRLHKCRAVS